MPRNKLNYKDKIAQSKGEKRGSHTHNERISDESYSQFLIRTQQTLSERVADKRGYIVSIPFTSVDAPKANVKEAIDITENLMKRLQYKTDKGNGYLVNPIGENEVARPLFIDELTLMQRGKSLVDFNFSESDVLYLSGHANFVVFGGLSPEELAHQYFRFLEETGIKEVKLAGCHTGSCFYEKNLPPLTVLKPEDLINSYAQKFSQVLIDLGLEDITVFGYRGALGDEKKKQKFERVAYHSYVDMFRFFPEKNMLKIEEVRGHEASVQFKNGVLVKQPVITADSVYDDGTNHYALTY